MDRRYSPIYSHLSSERVIFLDDDVTKESATALCALLIHYSSTSPEEDIHLFINTNGGDVNALFAIYDVMTQIEAPVSTIGLSKCYSAGSLILCAGRKGKRYIFKNAEVMLHGIQSSFPEVPYSDGKDSATYLKYLDTINNRLLKIISHHTGRPIEEVTADSKRDLYLDAKNAVKYGFVDKIL